MEGEEGKEANYLEGHAPNNQETENQVPVDAAIAIEKNPENINQNIGNFAVEVNNQINELYAKEKNSYNIFKI